MNIVYVPIEQLVPYTNNPRKNDEAVDKVVESIIAFGFRVPIIADKNNVIIAGHTRLKAAKKLGWKSVPVIFADDLNEDQVKAFRLADNKTSEFSEWDFEKLTEELNAINDIDMTLFGFDELADATETNERDDIGDTEEKFQLVIDCKDETDMQEKYEQLQKAGIECRVLTL